MKVVFLAPYALPFRAGGFESQVYHIYSELQKLGVDVMWHNFEDSNLNDVDILQVMSTDSSMLPMMKRARDLGVKVVLTPMQGSRAKSNAYLKTALSISRIPQLFSLHKLTYFTIHAANYLTPLCTFEVNRMVHVYGFSPNSIRIIPNGLDQAFFDDKIVNVNLPFEDYLLVVGRIEENKNQLTLIKVANALNLNLIVVGEYSIERRGYYEKCRSIAGKNIIFWGVEKNPYVLKTIYRNAKLTVVPSFSEMVPLVVFESLSQFTPVVCTNRCGIADDTIPGLLFSGIKKNALKDSVLKMISFNRESITKKGIYTWKDIANMYKSVYENLLKN